MPAPTLSFAVRNLRRRPGFSIAALLLLALGTGANAAVFSVVRGVLLKPLPFAAPDQLVAIWPGEFIAYQDIDYLGAGTTSLSAVTGQSPGWMQALGGDGAEPIKVTGARVVDNLFTTLGATALIGRTVLPGDGPRNVVVLSYALWQSRYGGREDTVGRTITIDQQPHEIVGVMPRGFELFEPGTDVWSPLPSAPGTSSHRTTFVQGIARLAPGATAEAASRELQALVPGMRQALKYDADWGRELGVGPLQESVVGHVRPTLVIMLGAVGLMLLLATVNVATLMLGRSVERAQEMAVRTALGASRARVVRQLLVENGVLSLCGGLAGVLLARAALPLLVSAMPADVPRVDQIALDWPVFAVVLGSSVIASAVVSIGPAFIATRPALQILLRQQSSTDTPGRRRLLASLVAAQVALAVVLGIGAGLMLRSVWNLQHVEPGFSPAGVLTFRLQTTSRYKTLAEGLPYFERMLERVRALPGVTNVGIAGHLPMSGYSWTIPVFRADAPPPDGTAPPQVGWRFVAADYFGAMRIPILQGRAFEARDRSGSTPVAMLNETLARQLFGEPARAVGQLIVQRGGGQPGDQRIEVVGVVGDVRHRALHEPPMPELYRPLAQTFMFPAAFVVRAAVPPGQLVAAVRAAAFEIDPTVPAAEMQPLSRLLAASIARPRLLAMLLSVFAAAGLLLGLVGVYAVVAYHVARRTREFGVRIALGAPPRRLAATVVLQGAGHAMAGIAVGLPAAFALAQVMSSVVFGVTPRDPLIFAALPVLLLLVTLAACLLPARRAAGVSPLEAIRTD